MAREFSRKLDLALCQTSARNSIMTIDKSLKSKSRLARSRNVLKRGERIEKLKADDRWIDNQSPFGLVKVRVQKVSIGKKKKKKKDDDDD